VLIYVQVALKFMRQDSSLSISLDMRALLSYFKESGQLQIISRQLKLEYEAAWYIQQAQPSPVLLSTPRGKVISNLLAKREVLTRMLGGGPDVEVYMRVFKALENPLPIQNLERPSLQDIPVDLYKLPALKFFEKDAGRYITAGIFIAKDSESGAVNASIHRALVLDEENLAVRLVPRHLHQIFRKAEVRGQNLPAAILIGAPPITYITAAMSPPYGVYEAEVANALVGGNLKGTDTLLDGVVLPMPAEIVIMGEFIAGKRADEGPFVDILGTYDIVRKEPVFRVDSISARQDFLYYTILPSGFEHILMMGFPREVAIWNVASKTAPGIKKVRLTPGGCGWLNAVISMEKTTEGDPKNVIMAAFAAHPSLKCVVVVDQDIDPDNPREIEWALATRMQPDEDIVIIRGARGSSLDPSADQESLLTSKIGIDATRPLHKDRNLFEKAKIPPPS
jgi:2,5-furandicarboxylate decarboxylase 1